MASTGLLTNINPYRSGNVAVDFTSKPLQQFLLKQQKEEAKVEALQKYYKDVEKSLNSAGLSQEEVNILRKKIDAAKGYAIKFSDKVYRPSSDGYEAQSTLDSLWRDASDYIQGAKEERANTKATLEELDKERARGKHVRGDEEMVKSALLPYGDPNHRRASLRGVQIFDPHNEDKYTKSITEGVNPIIQEDTQTIFDTATKLDTGFDKKVKKAILNNDEAKKLANNGLIAYKTVPGTTEHIDDLFKDKDYVKQFSDRYGEVFKEIDPVTNKVTKPEIKTVEDFAKAYALKKMDPERIVSEEKGILNREGKFQEWKKRNNITAKNAADNTNAYIKALALQGSQEIFKKAMAGYRTKESFDDNKSITKLNFPKTIIDNYVDKNAALGVQRKLKDKGFKYEKSELTPVFGEDVNENIFYAYPKLDDKGNIIKGQYDWKNAVNVTYDIKNTVSEGTAGSARTSDIIGGKNPKYDMLIKK
jgi:hypothetical protein